MAKTDEFRNRAAACEAADDVPRSFAFQELDAGVDTDHHVAPGYRARPLLRWGDKLFPDSLPFDPMKQTAASQLRQFGYNNDFLAFMPLPRGSQSSDRGLLCANHEDTIA